MENQETNVSNPIVTDEDKKNKSLIEQRRIIEEKEAQLRKEREEKEAIQSRLAEIEARQQEFLAKKEEEKYRPDDLVDFEKLDQYLHEREQKNKDANFKRILSEKYPDFLDVVTPANLALIEKEDKDEAYLIGKLNSRHDQALAAYKWLKANKFQVNSNQEKQVNKARMEANEDKPQPSSSSSSSSTSRPQFTSWQEKRDHRKKTWALMQQRASKA